MNAKGWNQSEIAKRIGRAQSIVSAMLNAETASLPRAETLVALCQSLGVSADWLLLGRGTPEGGRPSAGHQFQEGAMALLTEIRLNLDEMEARWKGVQPPGPTGKGSR